MGRMQLPCAEVHGHGVQSGLSQCLGTTQPHENQWYCH